MRRFYSLLARFPVLILWGLVSLAMLPARAQLAVNSTPPTITAPSGDLMCLTVDFNWQSTTEDATGAYLEFDYPPNLGNFVAGDATYPLSLVVGTPIFDPMTRKLRINLVDPFPAGTSGTLDLCLRFPPGVTPNGASATVPVTFFGSTGSGPLVPGTDSSVLNATAVKKATLAKVTAGGIQPAPNENVTYLISVDNSNTSGAYNLNSVVLTDTLPLSASGSLPPTVISMNPAPSSSAGNVYTWNLGTIPVGQTRLILVTVRYDSPTFSAPPLGETVVNTVNLTGTTIDPVSPGCSLAENYPRTLSNPDPNVTFTKKSSSPAVSVSTAADDVGENLTYTFAIANTGNVAIPNYVVEDGFPTGFWPKRIQVGRDVIIGLPTTATVEVQLADNPGVWVTVTGSPFATPNPPPPVFGNPSVNLLTNPALLPQPADGSRRVIRMRVTYASLSTGYNNGSSLRVRGEVRDDLVGMLPVTLSNTGDSTYTYGANPPTTATSTVTTEILDLSPRPVPTKSVVGANPLQPTDETTYEINVRNTFGSSGPITDPVVVDLLPAEVEYIPGSFEVVDLGGLSSVVVAGPVLVGPNQQLTFTGTGNIPAGSDEDGEPAAVIRFKVRVKAGVAPGTYINNAKLTMANAVVNYSGVAPQTVQPIDFSAPLNVVRATLLGTAKWVLGELDLPSKDKVDLDTGSPSLETRFPAISTIRPAGFFRYRIAVTNLGNVALKNVRIVDIFPWVGDVGVATFGTGRGSQWQANLVNQNEVDGALPAAPFPGTVTIVDPVLPTSSQTMTVQFSTAVNPCRDPLGASLAGLPGGCSAGTFAVGVPSPLSDARSVLFEFPGLVLEPLQRFEFQFYMRAPTAAFSEQVAWNSVGRAADANDGGSSPPASEPIKVGVKLQAASIGNYIWSDENDNGIQDGPEAALPGATVELFVDIDPGPGQTLVPAKNAVGASVPPQVTGSNGFYEFTLLAPSDDLPLVDAGFPVGSRYVVQVTAPAGYTRSGAFAGSTAVPSANPNDNTLLDSNGLDESTTAGNNDARSGSFTLTLGAEPTGDGTSNVVPDNSGNMTVDFGFVPPRYFGDLPDSGAGTGAGNYITTFADGGPYHLITSSLQLGALEDADGGAAQNAAATADNLDDLADEDAVTIPALTQGVTTTVTVDVQGAGAGGAQLNVFVDWNADGDFDDTDEVLGQVTIFNGANSVLFPVPLFAVPGTDLGVRFRLSQNGGLSATGRAPDGEVEDYIVQVGTTALAYDYGDLPDNDSMALVGAYTGTGDYETSIFGNGPRHQLNAVPNNGLLLGAVVDAESNGAPSALATGDDATGAPDDEDGVSIPTLYAGQTATVTVTVLNAPAGAKLNAFIDWNNDGDFGDAGETITELSVVNGANSLSVPAGAVTGANLGARFRLSTAGGLSPVGLATDGEVEDYVVKVVALDFGDLADTGAGTGAGNYETFLGSDGPRHALVDVPNTGLLLGTTVDQETDGAPSALATGDDTAGAPDDEDGVSIPALVAGETATVTVTVANAPAGAKLNAFIDWNNDGDFADAGETITELSVVNGANSLSVPVRAGAVTGANLGARFRLSTPGGLSPGGLSPVGLATDGGVEDYVVQVVPRLSLGHRVWMDTDNDGVIDPGEMGIDGATVQLFAEDPQGNPTGPVLQTKVTASDGPEAGYYRVDGLQVPRNSSGLVNCLMYLSV